MNQTSLIGRPLHAVVKSIVGAAEKRGIWSGPLTSSSPELARLWSAPAISTGMHVNETTAFTYSVLWACVNNISTDIASFPLMFYKREPNGGKTVLKDHKLYQLLHDAPNPEMTSMTFRGVLTSHALSYGTGYAEKVLDGAGAVRQLWPITPDRVTPRRDSRGAPYYEVARQDGTYDRLSADQMFVLPGSSYDGLCGRNIISLARESIGLGLAAERFGGTFYGNGSTFGGVFEHPGRMTDQALKNFRESVNAQHQGVERAHKFIVVEENMKYQKLGVDPNQAQFIETRQHQIEEMCRWFRMPPHKVQHLIRTSYNSAEQMDIEYYSDTLRPWCVRWEQEILRQLVARSEQRIQFAEHKIEGKLRGDLLSRYQAYAIGRNNGWLSADDIRDLENMNPLPDGQGTVYLVPANMTPANRLDEVIDKQVAPDPKPVVQAPEPKPKAEPDEDDRTLTTVTAIREALQAAETRIAEHTTKAAETLAQFTASQQSDAERQAAIAAHEQQASEARLEAAKLQALLLVAQEHAQQVEAAREADRIAMEEARQRLAEDAQREQDALTAKAAEDSARLEALLSEATGRLDAVEAERVQAREQVEALSLDVTVAQQALEQAHETSAAQRAQAVAEIERLQQSLAEAVALAEGRAKAASEAEAIVAILTPQVAEARAQLEEVRASHGQALADAEARATDVSMEAARANDAIVKLAEERAAHERTLALLKERTDAEVSRLQEEGEAQRDLILRIVGQRVSKEIERAKRNGVSPAKLLAWADGFYLLSEETWVDDMRPVMRQHLARIRSPQDVDAYTRAIVHPHLETAAAQIRAVAKGDPEDFQVSLDRLLTRWEQDRAASIAAIVAKEEVRYVRSL